MKRKGPAAGPGRSTSAGLPRIRTVREFDEAYTAPLLRVRRRRGLLPPRQRDARHRSHPRAGAHHHCRGRPVRPVGAVPRSQGDRQPAHHPAHLPPRRPLRIRRPAEWRRGRRLLGREPDRGFRRSRGLEGAPTVASARCTSEVRSTLLARLSISSFANSGPFPSSSCLKYTKTSRQPLVSRAIVSAQRADVVRSVALVAQAEVGVVGGDPHRRRQLLAVGDAEREVPRRQPLEDSSSNHDAWRNSNAAHARGRQLGEERIEQRHVLLQVRRQLKQQRAELVAERRRRPGRSAPTSSPRLLQPRCRA